jgi:hypothetical protein
MIELSMPTKVAHRMSVESAEYDPEDQMAHFKLKPCRQSSPWNHTVELDLSVEVVEALLNPKQREALIYLALQARSNLRSIE